MVEGGLGTHFTLETVRDLVLIIPEQFGQVKNLQEGGGKASTTDGIDGSALLWLAEGLMGRQFSQDVCSERPSFQSWCPVVSSLRSQVSGLPATWQLAPDAVCCPPPGTCTRSCLPAS